MTAFSKSGRAGVRERSLRGAGRWIGAIAALAVALFQGSRGASVATAAGPTRPNVVIFLADDLG
jgi:hypothetical protein